MKSTDEYLLVNTRDNGKLDSHFSLINLQRLEMLWEGLQFEDDWWVSAYHLYGEMAVFQKFEDTQNIEDRSVFGFNLLNQESIWSMEHVYLTGANGSQLFIKSEQDLPLIFNIQTQEWDEHQLTIEQESSHITYPVHYDTDNQHFETLAKFLKKKVNVELAGSCDYIEEEGVIFIAANHVNDGLKTLSLYVFDEAGNLLLQESLVSGVKGLVSGAFFIARKALIFVTGKNELKIYSIDEKI